MDGIKRVVITEAEIKERIRETGKYISEKYEGKPLLLAGVLKGAFIFMADLCREISIPCEIGFIAAESYFAGTESSGKVNITLDLKQDISGYHVIIAEDIIDSGRTLNELVKILNKRNPLSLEVIALLDKPGRRTVDFSADRVLFTIPDFFAVGYGLDCGEQFRGLPYVAEYDCGCN